MLLIVGKREAKEGTVSLRQIGRKDNEILTLGEAMVRLESEVLSGACSPLGLPSVDGRNEDNAHFREAAGG